MVERTRLYLRFANDRDPQSGLIIEAVRGSNRSCFLIGNGDLSVKGPVDITDTMDALLCSVEVNDGLEFKVHSPGIEGPILQRGGSNA